MRLTMKLGANGFSATVRWPSRCRNAVVSATVAGAARGPGTTSAPGDLSGKRTGRALVRNLPGNGLKI